MQPLTTVVCPRFLWGEGNLGCVVVGQGKAMCKRINKKCAWENKGKKVKIGEGDVPG